MSQEPHQENRISRKQMLRLFGAGGAGLTLGAGGATLAAGYAAARDADAAGDEGAGQEARVSFHGTHQAGISTPQQEHLHFAAFDLTAQDASEVADLLRAWSGAAARMRAGEPAGEDNYSTFLPPDDTGEAFDLSPARLTITFGFGPTFFEKDGEDRFGLKSRRPAALAEIPPLPGEALDAEKSDGDLCVQACADDPQVAFHAVRNLARIARGVAVMRWSQLGFGRVASTSKAQTTPRNLMGFKDGTANIKSEDEEAMDSHVWARPGDGPSWMDGGTYLVARRIRMLIEVWDRVSLDDQEKSIGRHKYTGAPIGAKDEFHPVDLKAKDDDGQPLVPENSHVRLSRVNEDERMLRRGYSFTDGMDPERGQLDAGLFFICFQRDPRKQFVPLQRRLGENDALNEYIQHTASALFACPPGVREGGYVGEALFIG